MSRIAQIQKQLPPRTAALVTDPVTRRYLTGFSASDGLLLIAPESACFCTDSRYIEAARASINENFCTVKEGYDGLSALCKALHIKTIWLESRITLAEARRWQTALPRVYFDLWGKRLDRLLRELRMCKSPAEVEAITRAQRIAEAAYSQITETITEGMTERDLALRLDIAMLQGGAEAVSFETIAVAGENGSKPHGVPGERKLHRGDLITMDFGAVAEGYHSDMTRTVALGDPGPKQRELYEIVLAAQAAGLAALGPGLHCKAADNAAREVIKAAGYGPQFRHGTGHGVGLEIHEGPSLAPRSRDILRPGMVVTVEPGIYLPGECGLRIEDMAVITEDGARNLTRSPKELLVI